MSAQPRLPLPRDPTVAPDADSLLAIQLFDETHAAFSKAIDAADQMSRSIRFLGDTRELAEQALAEAMRRRRFGRDAAIEHHGRIYRRTPDGRVTVERLADELERRFAGESA